MQKNHLYRVWWGIFVLIIIGGFTLIPQTHAQDQCGIADSVQYPVDTTQFQLVQNYAIANPRHQGRYHTGEDWFNVEGQIPGRSLGQPVRAVANGLVLLSGANSWGVDGGVIIIRHQLADGSYFFSQYGHIAQNDTVRLPSRLSCVRAGDIIAVIGDARPAPHLHFEIRVFVSGSDVNPGDNPGPGYTREHPFELGYRQPMPYITNLQAQLSGETEWQFAGRAIGQQPAPLLLNDNSLLHIDGSVLRRLTWDGRALWRVEQTRTPIHLFGYQANSYLVTGDGGVHQLNLENGVYEQSWQLDFSPIGAPVKMDGGWLYPSVGNEIVAVADDHRTVLWRKADIPAFTDGIATTSLTGLVGIDSRLWTLSAEGDVLHRADLRAGVSLAGGGTGELIAYTWGGLWQISSRAEWSLLASDAPTGGEAHGVNIGQDGRIFITSRDALHIFSAQGERISQISLPQPLTGVVSIHQYDDILFIVSGDGELIALREDGLICGQLRIYGGESDNHHWQAMGTDGTLRLRVGYLTMGLDWSQFIRGC
jgi:hypothetical protein